MTNTVSKRAVTNEKVATLPCHPEKLKTIFQGCRFLQPAFLLARDDRLRCYDFLAGDAGRPCLNSATLLCQSRSTPPSPTISPEKWSRWLVAASSFPSGNSVCQASSLGCTIASLPSKPKTFSPF